MEWLGLADAVQALREELTIARQAGEDNDDNDYVFEVGPVEVEFTVVAKKGGKGRLGVTFGVVTVGGEAGLGRDETHRLKVTLTPKDRVTGVAPEINDRVPALPDR
ncbi:trypco2 family protein [Phytohabitans rumicis]|uniref:Trypsin-co-occurring domain-containing protein n=1 Tax=Phytohabitans rumicis TaxID=1076125 RepID=A0A6V8L5U9_9ACTN|nr:trypco2 family protein [Phytohabitans rumicis]GFJ89407.1 hypothetical protein Prum_030490 [Phytohabitans rumicis]